MHCNDIKRKNDDVQKIAGVDVARELPKISFQDILERRETLIDGSQIRPVTEFRPEDAVPERGERQVVGEVVPDGIEVRESLCSQEGNERQEEHPIEDLAWIEPCSPIFNAAWAAAGFAQSQVALLDIAALRAWQLAKVNRRTANESGREIFWGALGMALTAGIGAVFGTAG
jgi:hypothetical protein